MVWQLNDLEQNLGGLKLVVRYEVDACLPPSEDVDDLAEALGNITFQDQSPKVIKLSSEKQLVIKKAGRVVPQEDIVEIGTKSERSKTSVNWRDVIFPQLYVSATPLHIMGYHNNGLFGRCEKRKTSDMSREEAFLGKKLVLLEKVLCMIQAIVIEQGKTGRLSFVRQGTDLLVYKRKSGQSCLPDEYLERFYL